MRANQERRLPVKRIKYTEAQKSALNAAFQIQHHPTAELFQDLALLLDVPVHNLKIWFQNTRADRQCAAEGTTRRTAAAARAKSRARRLLEACGLGDVELDSEQPVLKRRKKGETARLEETVVAANPHRFFAQNAPIALPNVLPSLAAAGLLPFSQPQNAETDPLAAASLSEIFQI